MVAFVRPLATHGPIYRRYPLTRIWALKSAWCKAAPEELRRLVDEFETIARGRKPNNPRQLEQATAQATRWRQSDRGRPQSVGSRHDP